jgi:hypothetical protein
VPAVRQNCLRRSKGESGGEPSPRCAWIWPYRERVDAALVRLALFVLHPQTK